MRDDANIMRYAKKETREVAQEHEDIKLETESDVRAEASRPSLSVHPKYRDKPSTGSRWHPHLFQMS
jgi:hypothetical protein